MTTWNGADRFGSEDSLYFGRPNTWGQRYSNVLIQQSDLVIAVGTRLGLQQTGFNWQEFAPLARVVQVDIDISELEKGHPSVDLKICVDSTFFLQQLFSCGFRQDLSEWTSFCSAVRELLPLDEESNASFNDYVNPYSFVQWLSKKCDVEDVIIPCSSGGAFTVMMQAFEQKSSQVMVTNKGLASMGYGLAGAIGASIALPERRTILVEGDGGFSQNLQELAMLSLHGMNLKVFIFSNEGYASIRMTQRNYFNGDYLGCDTKTGLGFPDWKILSNAYGIDCIVLNSIPENSTDFEQLWASSGPAIFILKVHPEQTYFPKIASQILPDGRMKSSPLHMMSPDLPPEKSTLVMRYLTF